MGVQPVGGGMVSPRAGRCGYRCQLNKDDYWDPFSLFSSSLRPRASRSQQLPGWRLSVSQLSQVSARIERRILREKDGPCTNSSQHLAPAPYIHLGPTRANARWDPLQPLAEARISECAPIGHSGARLVCASESGGEFPPRQVQGRTRQDQN